MKTTFMIPIHSIVDVITNSSTEIYVLDTEKTVALVEEIIREKEKEFPTEYGYRVYVQKAEKYDLQGLTDYIDEDDAVRKLKMLGYKIEPPSEDFTLNYVIISCERGCIHPGLHHFIEDTFTVIDHDTER